VIWHLHQAAQAELREAALWYEDEQRGLGEQFLDEYGQVIERILRAPKRFGKIETVHTRRNIRRCFVKRFPYYVAYEIVGNEIVVLAVAHTKRRPGYWVGRR
jgi:plasmid stabilization system protein ParE